MTGAKIIIHLLERQGIRIIPGIPGGANLPLYDALSESSSIRHVLARHEQGAGFIAQGMARATGRPAVCFATSGPGSTNLLTSIADAKLDSIPVIFITGQVSRDLIGTDAFQEVDTYGMSIPITKHNFLVRAASELLDVIPGAFRIAASGRPGPVLIDIPKDVQTEMVEVDAWPQPGLPEPISAPDSAAIDRAAELINASQCPVLYLGGGAIHSGVGDMALHLAEKGGIPATMTLMGLGAIPLDHPLSIGMLGMHAARYTNLILEECDLLIGIGVRFDDRATGRVAEFCPRAKVVHIDIDPCEIDKLRSAQIGIVGDAARVMGMLLPMVREQSRSLWLNRVRDLKKMYPIPAGEDLNTPYGLIPYVASLVGDEAVIATDVGQHQMWTAQLYPFRRPRQFLTSGGLGTMGFGLPAAIGASLACPDRPVICFSGDGSLMMNIQELATAVEQNVNIKIVLMNNCSLGLVRQQQNLFYGKRLFASCYKSQVDFVRIAEGFGLKPFDLGRESDPHSALSHALMEKGPSLIHAPISNEEMVFPMVPPGAPNRQMIGGEAHA